MLQAKRIVSMVVVALALSGCGANPFQQVQYDQYGNPIGAGYNQGYSDPYNSGGGYAGGGYSDPYSGGSGYNSGYNTGYGNGYGNTQGTAAYPASGPITGSLSTQVVVGGIKKVKKGLLWWAKLEATGQIRNSATVAVSGDITFHFLKKGKVVETRFERLADLQPGAYHNFSVTSKNGADDLQVVISAQPGVTVPTTPTSPYGTGSSYGSGSTYGNDPYSGSTGYGTSY